MAQVVLRVAAERANKHVTLVTAERSLRHFTLAKILFWLRPCRFRSHEFHPRFGQRMLEAELPSMQAKGCIIHARRLRVTALLVRQVSRIPNNRKAKLPKVDANLVRPASNRRHAKQRRAIGISLDDFKFRNRGLAILKVDIARAQFNSIGANRSIAAKTIFGRMTDYLSKVKLFDLASGKLLLNGAGKVPRASKNDNPCRVGI